MWSVWYDDESQNSIIKCYHRGLTIKKNTIEIKLIFVELHIYTSNSEVKNILKQLYYA